MQTTDPIVGVLRVVQTGRYSLSSRDQRREALGSGEEVLGSNTAVGLGVRVGGSGTQEAPWERGVVHGDREPAKWRQEACMGGKGRGPPGLEG